MYTGFNEIGTIFRPLVVSYNYKLLFRGSLTCTDEGKAALFWREDSSRQLERELSPES